MQAIFSDNFQYLNLDGKVGINIILKTKKHSRVQDYICKKNGHNWNALKMNKIMQIWRKN